MQNKKPKVLVIATSRKTRGGITSVIKAHETGTQWEAHQCKWIETHRDNNVFTKIWYLFNSLFKYLLFLPFYDIVHIHIATRVSAQRKQLFIYPAKWLKRKLILHFHPSNEKFLFKKRNQKLYNRLFNKADLILVLSEQWERWLEKTLDLHRNIRVLYNPCPNVNRDYGKREKNILIAGSVIPRKGYEVIIKGFASIAKNHPDWKLIFAGNGELQKAQLLVKKYEIEEQVEFLGWVKGKEKEKAFQNASIYCLASNGEGYPMGLLDAWAYGIPAIVTPVGGIPDIINHGENGLIFPVGNFRKLSIEFDKLIRNNKLQKSIVKNADSFVKGVFNVESINEELSKIYTEI